MLWMLVASFLFASMGVCVKLASTQFSAAELVFYRGFIALLLIGGWMAWQGRSASTAHVRSHLWRGIAGTAALIGSFEAITRIPLAAAVTLGYTSPLFLALLLRFWLREPVRWPAYIGLGVGFLGVVLLLRPTLSPEQWLGAAFGLGCGILSSIAYLNVRTLGLLGEPEWRTVFYFSLISSLGGLPWVLWDGAQTTHTLSGWLQVFGVGALGAAAQLCMTTAYKRVKTLATASLAYSTVAFSSLYGILIWQEVLSWIAWGGIALIVIAGLMASAFSGACAESDARASRLSYSGPV